MEKKLIWLIKDLGQVARQGFIERMSEWMNNSNVYT